MAAIRRCLRGLRVVVEKHGEDIFKHSKLQEYDIPVVKDGEVRIKMLAAPVNPSDVYSISGSYGSIPPLPFTVGFEGVGEVEEIGAGVTSLSIGDWVLPSKSENGTWRTHSVLPAQYASKVDKSLGYKNWATVLVNPTSAYMMLKDVVELKPGDTIIQNGANSTVGLAVIQFAKALGVKTINVVRERKTPEENEALKKKLEDLGATLVITDQEQLSRKDNDPWPNDVTKPRLAIDCVAGKPGSDLARHLVNGGTLVNYGMLSLRPLNIAPGLLIFKSIKVAGFWLTTYLKENPQRLAAEVFPFIMDLAKKGQFQFPEYELFTLKDYQSAMKHFLDGYSNKKQLLIMDDELFEKEKQSQ